MVVSQCVTKYVTKCYTPVLAPSAPVKTVVVTVFPFQPPRPTAWWSTGAVKGVS